MYLGRPSVHVKPRQLAVAGQAGVFALVLRGVGAGLHVEAGLGALLIVCLVGLRGQRDRQLGVGRVVAQQLGPVRRDIARLGGTRCHARIDALERAGRTLIGG